MGSNTLYAVCLEANIMCEWGLHTHNRSIFFILLVCFFLQLAVKQTYGISDAGKNPTVLVYGGEYLIE